MSPLKPALICLLACLLAGEAMAGRWKVRGTKGLDLNTEFSSNVFLDGADDETADSVISARGRLNISRRGSRASVNISYAPELRYYVRGDRDPEIVHFLNANGDIELIERLFGISANARAGQRVIDSNRAFTQDGITNPDNITDTYSVTLSPYLLPIRLGDYAVFELNANYSLVLNSDSDVQDSRGRNATLKLTSGRYFNRLTWSLETQHSIDSYDNRGDDEVFSNLAASLNYYLSRSWQLNSSFGYDDNNVNTTRDINGGFWRLGATYTPHSRASLSAGLGERYNSEDYYLDFSYRHRRIRWFANYDRNIQTAQDEFLERNIFPDEDVFGDPVLDPTLDESSYEVVPGAPLTDTVYISDRLNLGLDWSRRRTNLSLNAGYVRRDDLRIDSITRDWSLRFRLGHRLSPRSSASLNGRWFQRLDDSLEDNDYQQWSGGVSYSYRMSQRMSLGLFYRFTRRDADNGEDFEEDRLGLSLVADYD